MEQDLEYRQQLVRDYIKTAEPLFKYLPWLESHVGSTPSTNYGGEEVGKHSVTFPVYDGT